VIPSINIDNESALETRKAILRKLKKPNFVDVDKTSVKQLTIRTSTVAVNHLLLKERKTEVHEAFRAIARVQRHKVTSKIAPRIIRALVDPGAELNLIRKELLNVNSCDERKLKVHAHEEVEVTLCNNGKVIGHVQEAVYLTFCLDNIDGTQKTYHEWVYVWENMNEEMILGAIFCKEQGFTCFHSKLLPWDVDLSNSRPKLRPKQRDIEQIDVVPEEDKAPFERRASEQLLPNPLSYEEARKRERVISVYEKIGENRSKHQNQQQQPTLPTAGRRVQARRIFMPRLQRNDHSNHVPVAYDKRVCKQVASILMQRAVDDQHKLVTRLKQLSVSGVTLTLEEAETLKDTARLCAAEAERIYRDQHHMLHKTVTTFKQAKEQRYFMNATEAPVGDRTHVVDERRFRNGQCVLLQNLSTHSDLNDKPARIVTYEEDTHLYVVSVSNPRGYWHANESNLRAIDPLPTKDDYTACGIDMSTGQPTLDPLAKPVHRQYGNPYSPELTAKITQLLDKYKHVFGKDISQPCKFRAMSIELVPGANLPRNPRYWKNSPAQREEVRAQLQSFMDMGIVRPSTTSVVSNVLLVKRPGMPGKFRFTIDFRVLNDATVATPWQMPEVQSQLDRLAGNLVFGCIDLSSYYHQIELDEGSRFLTGFVTEDGVYEYQRVPMGLKNACAHAQSELQKAIDCDPILSKYGLRNYFDDLPLAAKSEIEFLEQMEAVLKLGETYGLKFNLDKSIFGVDSITHVGFIVNKNGIQVDPQRIEALKEIEVPRSMKAVQSVLGVWNYIRNFIPNFSSRALPLTNLVGSKKKAKTFVWTEQCQAAFDDIKAATLDTSLLANINYSKQIFIRCDSSQYGAGAVLFQFDDEGRECPISYASRKYTLAERNYCTFQQEAAAVVWSLEKFANFHQGHHVVVQSDHKNLSWIKKSAMPQLTRWRLRLQDFDFSLEYYKGADNVVADGLSRKFVDDKDIDISIRDFLPEHAAQQSYLQGNLPVRCLNQYSIQSDSYRKRTASEAIWERPEQVGVSDLHSDSDSEHEEGELWVEDSQVVDDDDIVMNTSIAQLNHMACANVHNEVPIEVVNDERPPIPHLEEEARTVFDSVHNCTVGHAGVLVTLNRVLRSNKSWAPRDIMIQQIDQFLSACTVCQKFRKRHNRRTDERFVIQGNPFEELSVDILKLPKRDCLGNLYVVVVVDSFSRWVSLYPVPDKSALSAARAVLMTIGNFGVPLTIRSDGGKEFINDIIASIEYILDVKHHKIIAYHHEGNSLAEKANRSVLENLRNLIFDKRYVLNGPHQWSDLLPLVQRIMNASFNSSVGCSPASLLFGENIDLDRCLLTLTNKPITHEQAVPDYIAQLTFNQRILLERASMVLHATHAKNIAKWNVNHRGHSELRRKIQEAADDENASVWVLARVLDDEPREKWQPKWAGPFKLLDFKEGSDSVLRLYDTVKHVVTEAHINDVALWDGLFESSVEGMTRVAEADAWDYPMDAIMGIALQPEQEDDEPLSLPLDRPRQVSNKHRYLFAVKWRGYPEPSWEPFNSVKNTSTFALFANANPALKLV
jgi:hypothetical protein